MTELVSPNGRIRCGINEQAGGRVSRLEVDGLSLLVERSPGIDPIGWGLYPMVPWAGRVREGRFVFEGEVWQLPANLGPHAIHGTCFDAPWASVLVTDDSAELAIAIPAPWPFGGTARQQITVRDDRIELVLSATAPPERAMPVTLGWHPWIRRVLERGDPLELDVDLSSARCYRRDPSGIATGELVAPPAPPWDDCFSGAGSIELRWPGALTVQLEHDCSHLTVYTETDHAVCVEPQTGPPDAFTIEPAPAHLAAGATLVARASLVVSGEP